jgi:hypothetical protein
VEDQEHNKVNTTLNLLQPGDFLFMWKEESGHLLALTALPPRKAPPVPVVRRLGGSQIRYGCYEEDENLLCLPGIEPRLPGGPIRHLVAVSTVLSQMMFQDEICPVTNWLRGASLIFLSNSIGQLSLLCCLQHLVTRSVAYLVYILCK